MPVVVLKRKRKQGPGNASLVIPIGTRREKNWWNGLWGNPTTITTTSNFGFQQVTWDNLHPDWVREQYGKRKRLPYSPADQGGDFSSFNVYDKSVIRGYGTYYIPPSGMTQGLEYVGGFFPAQWPQTPFTTADLQNVGQSGKFTGEFGTATADGPSAWNRFKPKTYVTDMGQFVGEIGQTLPMLRTSAKMFSHIVGGLKGRTLSKLGRVASDHWLNAQFGWAPFIGDLVKFVESYQTVQRKLAKLIEQNGNFQRRGGLFSSSGENVPWTFVAESTGQHTQYVMPSTSLNILQLVTVPPGNGKASYSKIEYRELYRTWFYGAFRYWVPKFNGPDEAINKLSMYLKVYGLNISPKLVWNLTPWSWLADWCGNIGVNIANYTTALQDNLTAKYAYIMKETVGELRNSSWVGLKPPYYPVTFEWKRGFSAKTRRHASPYGFTLDWPQFSAFQVSILAALGFPRLFRS